LVLGQGELRSGGFDRDSILADALEAVIGAIYKDGGWPAARDVILDQYRSRLEKLDPEQELKDPKTRLQEYLQKRARPVPDYRVLKVEGEPHRQHFVVECQIDGLDGAMLGEGSSRRAAEQEAARRVYEAVTSDDS
jgi:ribonuclease-3